MLSHTHPRVKLVALQIHRILIIPIVLVYWKIMENTGTVVKPFYLPDCWWADILLLF